MKELKVQPIRGAGFQAAPHPTVSVRKGRGPSGVRAVSALIGFALLGVGTYLWYWRGENVIFFVGLAVPGLGLLYLGARGWRSGA